MGFDFEFGVATPHSELTHSHSMRSNCHSERSNCHSERSNCHSERSEESPAINRTPASGDSSPRSE